MSARSTTGASWSWPDRGPSTASSPPERTGRSGLRRGSRSGSASLIRSTRARGRSPRPRRERRPGPGSATAPLDPQELVRAVLAPGLADRREPDELGAAGVEADAQHLPLAELAEDATLARRNDVPAEPALPALPTLGLERDERARARRRRRDVEARLGLGGSGPYGDRRGHGDRHEGLEHRRHSNRVSTTETGA